MIKHNTYNRISGTYEKLGRMLCCDDIGKQIIRVRFPDNHKVPDPDPDHDEVFVAKENLKSKIQIFVDGPYTLVTIKYGSFLCEQCHKESNFICVRCKQTYYCSKECQKASWLEHKNFCYPYPTESYEKKEPPIQEIVLKNSKSEEITLNSVEDFHGWIQLDYFNHLKNIRDEIKTKKEIERKKFDDNFNEYMSHSSCRRHRSLANFLIYGDIEGIDQ